MDTISILLRVLISFVSLLIITRILGNKQLSQLTFFNYVTGITIGSMAAMVSIDKNIPIPTGLISIGAWGMLTLLVGVISLKSSSLRLIVDGQPIVVIRNGRILEESLTKARLNLDDLTMMLRKKNAFSVDEVDYAILEPDGDVSVLKKQNFQSVTKKDMEIVTKDNLIFPSEVIADGVIVRKNIAQAGLDEKWLYSQLKKSNVSLENVFYAELQRDKTLYIVRKEKNSY